MNQMCKRTLKCAECAINQIKLLKSDSNTPVDKIDVFSCFDFGRLHNHSFFTIPFSNKNVEWIYCVEKSSWNQEYDQRLDLIDAIVAYFVVFLCSCVKTQVGKVLQTILKVLKWRQVDLSWFHTHWIWMECFKQVVILLSCYRNQF